MNCIFCLANTSSCPLASTQDAAQVHRRVYAYVKANPSELEISAKMLEAYLLEAYQDQNGEWIAELEVSQYSRNVRNDLVRAKLVDYAGRTFQMK